MSPNILSTSASERFDLSEVFPKEVNIIRSTTNYPKIKTNVKHDVCARGLIDKGELNIFCNQRYMLVKYEAQGRIYEVGDVLGTQVVTPCENL